MKTSLALLSLVFIALAAPAQVQVQPVPTPRTALLMGVDAYSDPTFPQLPEEGIASDLDSMKTVLENLGFTVTVVRNPSLGEAKSAVDTFGSAVKTRGGTSLFYFTGHGAEHEGKNYLIPTGTAVSEAADLNDEALSANRILARMESAGTKVNLLFLDCCRNALTKAGGETGLAPMTARGSLIGFATRSGDVANTTVTGSPYTRALVARLSTPALSLPDMHTLVTQDLETGALKQRPGSYVDLGGIYQLLPQTVAMRGADTSSELERLRLENEALRRGTAMPVPPSASSDLSSSASSPFTNSLGMKFVPVPGTKVMFCVHETRNADYAAYAAANSGVDSKWKSVASGKEDHPVVNVSWEDAQAFCKWLSTKEGKTYRLPTDHEWSCAVGIGDREDASASPESKAGHIAAVYPWGGDFPPMARDGNYIICVSDGNERTAPVMRFQGNAFGLYDLGGNVWEWCGDWYNTKQEYRVLRGGSWLNHASSRLLSSGRLNDQPTNRDGSHGFRLVLVSGG
jgi:hypothetical protein